MSLDFFHPFESLLFDATELPVSGHHHHHHAGSSTRSPNYTTVMSDGVALLTVELPGVSKNMLELSVHNNVISLTGKRPASKVGSFSGVSPAELNKKQNGAADSLHASEKNQEGQSDDAIVYSAKFKLVYDVDVDGIKAEFKDGLLKMSVPKKKQSESRQLMIE